MATALETETKTLDELLKTHVYVNGQLVEKKEVEKLVEKGLLSKASIENQPNLSDW